MKRDDLPGKLVGVVDPEIRGLAQGSLHFPGSPDLLKQDALGVIECIATECDIILVHDRVGGLYNVEGVQGDAAFPALVAESFGPSGKGLRDVDLAIDVNSNVCMAGAKALLIKARSGVGRSHAK
jgi:hypothetical protein